jgi:hypothetical protein
MTSFDKESKNSAIVSLVIVILLEKSILLDDIWRKNSNFYEKIIRSSRIK